MKFISKLYFNIFKRIGNLRLLFIVSCLFAFISFITVFNTATHSVAWINLNSISVETMMNDYNPNTRSFNYGTPLYKFVRIFSNNHNDLSETGITSSVIAKKYCVSGLFDDAFNFAKEHFNDVGEDKKFSSPELLCQGKNQHILYSVKYLWNFLWVIFWFYLPFLIVLPIKFVVDGYRQDKETNKK